MPDKPYSFEQFEQDCNSVSADAATIGGAGVGALGLGLTASPLVGIGAGIVAQHAIEAGWDDACSLPGMIAEAVGPQQSQAIDSAPSNDQSVSIDD